MFAAILTICGATMMLTSCSDTIDNPVAPVNPGEETVSPELRQALLGVHLAPTWKGYEPDELSTSNQNAMGDYSNTHLLKLSTQVRATLRHPWKIVFGASYYRRSTNYKYYSSHMTDSYELRGGIEWHL